MKIILQFVIKYVSNNYNYNNNLRLPGIQIALDTIRSMIDKAIQVLRQVLVVPGGFRARVGWISRGTGARRPVDPPGTGKLPGPHTPCSTSRARPSAPTAGDPATVGSSRR